MSGGEAYVLLEDGALFGGELCGAVASAVGEVVFTTGMAGYQESVSDPSFAGQLLVFSYPHIGNYGACGAAMESRRAWARAAIMRDAREGADAPGAERGWLSWLAEQGVPAITGVDTRALVRHIRAQGAMRGGLFDSDVATAEAMRLVRAEPPIAGRDLVGEVSPDRVRTLGGGDGPLIAVLDTGVKESIVAGLASRGATVRVHPAASTAEELLSGGVEGVVLGNGPGDPAALEGVVETVRALIDSGKPIWGICLGHQLLCRALGLATFKLPFGHRGANHPVKDLRSGQVEITSQNHGFAVLGPGGEQVIARDEPVRWETEFGPAKLTHVNLYDRTVEGLELVDVDVQSVQYHPEAAPGPHDSAHMFDRFLERVAGKG